jgi:hypothetical protein
MFKNISDLKNAFGIEDFIESRLSRKGNWVVSGDVWTVDYPAEYHGGAGTITIHSISAVYKNDGSLISWTRDLVDFYDI